MAFLNEQMMAKMAHGASVERHPMLKTIKLDTAVKMAYLEGCVLAALIDDEQIVPAEGQRVFEIGCSIGLSESEVEDCIRVVKALSSDEEKRAFVGEMLGAVKSAGVSKYFVDDFRSVLASNGEIDPKVLQMFDWFGVVLFEDADWQEKEKKVLALLEVNKYLKELLAAQTKWPGTFDRADILRNICDLGVPEHSVCVALEYLVPLAKRYFETAKLAIPSLIQFAKKHHSQGIPSYQLPDKFEFELTEESSMVKLLNCLQCMETLCCGDKKFSGARLDWDSCDYECFSRFYGQEFEGVKIKPNKICWRWNDSTSEKSAFDQICKFYSDLIAEYELRSKF